MRDRLFDIFERILEIDRENISFDTKIKDIPQWDSLASVLIVSEIQEVVGGKISLQDVENLETVGEFFDFVCSKE